MIDALGALAVTGTMTLGGGTVCDGPEKFGNAAMSQINTTLPAAAAAATTITTPVATTTTPEAAVAVAVAVAVCYYLLLILLHPESKK